MKQNYSFIKLFMLTVMALFAGNVMAEDIIWSEDFSSYEANSVPSEGTYNYVCVDGGSATKIYNDKLAGGTAPELLVGKSGGSFTATVVLGGKSGEMMLQFKTNRPELKVEVTGATLGEKHRSGNTDTYPLTGASGTLTIKFIAGSSNARLDDIKLYQGTALKPAGLSWGKASTSVTLGDEESYKNIPTLANENNLTVTYTSSDEAVATVSSAGIITVVGAGKATITAAFEGNSEYEAQTVSIDITVNEATPETPATEITVAEALEKINALGTEKTAYVDNKAAFNVKGYIVEIEEISPKPDGYGNATFTIADSKGGSNVITVFRCKDIENKDFTDGNKIKVGDLVVVTGALQIFVKGETAKPEISGPSGGPSCYLVSINDPSTSEPTIMDITVAPESGDIAEAVAAEAKKVTDGGNVVGNIKIDLAEKGSYTINNPIIASKGIEINGNGSTIDASGLSGNMIEMAMVENPTEWTKADVSISKLTVKGLKKALFYSACKNYVAENFIIEDCVVELAADATTIDYTKGSTAVNLTIMNSTFYAPTATTKAFYSSQSGQKTTEYDASAIQTFTFKKNTMYNLAPTKNFFTHRQNNQTWLTYDVEQNIFVDCGKSGQVIKGMNGGSGGKNPTWIISGNLFNFGGADTSANEETGDEAEPIKDSVEGIITFTDVTAPDFSGAIQLTSATQPTSLGDPRWTLTYEDALSINSAEYINDNADAPAYNLAGQRVSKQVKGIIIKSGRKYVK